MAGRTGPDDGVPLEGGGRRNSGEEVESVGERGGGGFCEAFQQTSSGRGVGERSGDEELGVDLQSVLQRRKSRPFQTHMRTEGKQSKAG